MTRGWRLPDANRFFDSSAGSLTPLDSSGIKVFDFPGVVWDNTYIRRAPGPTAAVLLNIVNRKVVEKSRGPFPKGVMPMSLNYDLGEIPDYKNLCYLPDEVDEDGKETFSLNPVTRALTFHAMSIGMREITKKNWKEFFIRVAAYEAVEGASLHKTGASYPAIPRPITKGDVVNHIGMATNVTTRNASEFHKILAKNLCLSEELKTKLD